jgi:hypothetical protein
MLAAPALALLLAAPPESYPLHWKLKEGDVFYNKTSVEMDQTVEVMGRTKGQKVTAKTVLRFRVKSAAGGATVVEMTYLENKIEAEGLPGANVGGSLKNVSFTATLNDRMEVTKLEGYDKFIDALAADDDAQKRLLRVMIPETAVRQMVSQTFVAGPGNPAPVGGTWPRKAVISLGPLGSVELREAFRLDSVKGGVASISEKADLAFKAGGDGDSGSPFKITKADLKADRFEGSHTFDVKAGRLVGSKVELDLSGSLTISVAGQTIEAKVTQKMRTSGEITEKNPTEE